MPLAMRCMRLLVGCNEQRDPSECKTKKGVFGGCGVFSSNGNAFIYIIHLRNDKSRGVNPLPHVWTSCCRFFNGVNFFQISSSPPSLYFFLLHFLSFHLRIFFLFLCYTLFSLIPFNQSCTHVLATWTTLDPTTTRAIRDANVFLLLEIQH